MTGREDGNRGGDSQQKEEEDMRGHLVHTEVSRSLPRDARGATDVHSVQIKLRALSIKSERVLQFAD